MHTMNTQSALAIAPVLAVVDGIPTTSSNEVADFFGRDHKSVLRAIENLTHDLPKEFTERNFAPSEYTDSTGRTLPAYRLTRDGFTLLAMGFTGKKALAFKLAYIDAFNRMERELYGKTVSLPHLITTDQAGEIRTLIDERFPDGRHRPYAWSRFNNHFRISGYKNLPAARFDEACAYIPTMPRKDEAENTDLIALIKSRRWLLTHDHKGLMKMSEVPNDAVVLTEKEIHQHLEAHGHAIVKKDEWVRRADILQLLSA